MTLIEAVDTSPNEKIKELSDIFGKSLSVSEENYVYDNWRAFYEDPERYSNLVDIIKQDLDTVTFSNMSNNEIPNLFDEKLSDTALMGSEDKKPKYGIGSIEYDANEGRRSRISQYKKLKGLTEDFEITEDNIDDWAVNNIACRNNRSAKRVRAELLGNKWNSYEC